MKKINVLFLLGVLAVLAGCSSGKTYAPLEAVDVDYEALAPYELGVGDSLSVMVWGNGDLSMDTTIRPDGKISLPLIGDVTAAGKTAAGLGEELEKKLSSFVRSPKVTVVVGSATNGDYTNRIRITGAVGSPMSIPYSAGMTVLDLVLLSGGPTEFASANRAKLYRKVDGKLKIYGVYLKDILEKGDLRSNYELQPSDILTVPESVF